MPVKNSAANGLQLEPVIMLFIGEIGQKRRPEPLNANKPECEIKEDSDKKEKDTAESKGALPEMHVGFSVLKYCLSLLCVVGR